MHTPSPQPPSLPTTASRMLRHPFFPSFIHSPPPHPLFLIDRSNSYVLLVTTPLSCRVMRSHTRWSDCRLDSQHTPIHPSIITFYSHDHANPRDCKTTTSPHNSRHHTFFKNTHGLLVRKCPKAMLGRCAQSKVSRKKFVEKGFTFCVWSSLFHIESLSLTMCVVRRRRMALSLSWIDWFDCFHLLDRWFEWWKGSILHKLI